MSFFLPSTPQHSLASDIESLERRNAHIDDEMESFIDSMRARAIEKAENSRRIAEFRKAIEMLKQAGAQNSKTTGFAA